MIQTVLILGASGKIGSHATRAFAAAGWTVRRYDRSTNNITAAAMGADVIVNGMNPPNYQNWDTMVPETTAQVITAARASGATVIIPGNIYHFGHHTGTLDENTPQHPNSIKGQIRADMEARYRAAGIPTIVLRAGNFIDPDGNGDHSALVFLRDVKRGKISGMGPADVQQAYAYLPDWARAAVALAEQRDTLPTFADIPFPGYTLTTRHIADRAAALTGRAMKITPFPWWLFNMTALVWPMARELREMRYLSDMPHRLSDVTFNRLLPDFAATPFDTALAQCLARYIDPDHAVRAKVVAQ